MAISAVDNNQSFFSRISPFKSKAVAAPAQNKISSADGDTLKLSGTSQNAVSKTTTYAPPKPVTGSSASANADSVLKK